MSLRSKLIAAFVLMAVLPLALVTVASYRTSVRAFRQAVEAEATNLAGDMGQRMEVVTSEIGRRVERFWDAPSTDQWGAAQASEDVAVRIPGFNRPRLNRNV